MSSTQVLPERVRSPVRRGRPPSLTRNAVIAAGLALASERGAAAVSLRVVAERLGVHQTSLYTYVENKSALMRAMLDHAITEQLPLPDPNDARPPTEQLKSLFTTLRDLAAEHPELLALVGRSPVSTNGPAQAAEVIRHLLSVLGLDLAGQMRVYTLLYHQTISSALILGNRRRAAAEAEIPPTMPELNFSDSLSLILDVLVPALVGFAA